MEKKTTTNLILSMENAKISPLAWKKRNQIKQ